jgi:hypothetical protein
VDECLQDEVGGANPQNTTNDSIKTFGDHYSNMGGANRGVEKESSQGDIIIRPKDTNRKKTPVYNNTNLPLNMLRKLPGPIHAKKKSANKKRRGKEGNGDKRDDKEMGSDSIQNSSDSQSQTDEDDGGIGSGDGSPWQDDDVDCVDITPLAHLEGGGFVTEEDPEAVAEVVYESREVVEAHKLIAIGQELGIIYQGVEGDDVARMMGMEVRDRVEKEGMENNNGYQ